MSDAPAKARVRRSKVSLVWIIPVLALAVAAYLGIRTIRSEGPQVTLTFKTGDGLVAGQTKVRHKAVQLGQVESVRLAPDMQTVVVEVRMQREAAPYLTDQARFWVVRPRLTAGSISGIETLVSGAYIEMDPGGSQAGQSKAEFVGLESPPAVRSGEPGRTFTIMAERLGSLGAGAPVFYRDITVGEVLGYDIGDGTGPVAVTLFIREPFDKFVREDTHFWNASGLSVQIGGDGVHVEVASLQALVSGGVAFDSPRGGTPTKQAALGTEFKLYRNASEAESAGYKTRTDFVSYFENSVRGLTRGSPVEFFGLQIGTITDVALDFDPASLRARIRVRYEIQPERFGDKAVIEADPVSTARRMIEKGLRAQLRTGSFITGSQVLALDFVPGAAPATLVMDDNAIVIPSAGGGIDNILLAVSNISSKLDRLPLDEIGQNLNATLRGAAGAMGSVQELARKAESGLSPVLSKLPAVIAALQDAVTRAGRTFGSIESSYGRDSQFNRELERAMVQVGDTARSIRLLADFLDRHPEALVRGRASIGAPR